MNETKGGKISFFHASAHMRNQTINHISNKKIKRKSRKTLKKKVNKKQQKNRKKRKKSKKRKGGFRQNQTSIPRSIFSQGFIEHHNNMFRDEPRAFIIAMMTHIRNRYVMDNLYSHGSLQDFQAYLYQKINEFLSNASQEDRDFYTQERLSFFDVDQDGNEILSMDNSLLEDLSGGNDHEYFISMINLYRGLPRDMTDDEILGTD